MKNAQTILIVDDECMVLNMIQAMLTYQGYKVVAAQGGNEAVRLLEQRPDLDVDLALIDMMMPDMGGIETARQFRKLRPDFPILFMSGYADGPGAGPEGSRNLPFIPKPFTAISLDRRIRDALGTQEAAPA